MKFQAVRQLYALCAIGAALTCSCSSGNAESDLSIVPVPESATLHSGNFTITQGTTIGYADDTLLPAAQYLSSLLSPATGLDITVQKGDGSITLAIDSIAGPEGAYTLKATPKNISIIGNSYGGVIAGIESMRQMLPAEIESRTPVDSIDWTIPAVDISDAPRFAWRGIMLDVSRHFYTKQEVMNLLEVMALYKMNRFHWHLTDDQGWRVEIKKYPLLTGKGAWRKFNSQDRDCIYRARTQKNPDFELPVEKLRIVDGDTLYGGYYTQADIREIVDFATVRGIEVIPEIDMPGHMLAAVSNYNGVACFDETGWGKSFSSPVCPGKDSAMEFCRNVYDELIDLFPGRYIHIGGDEVEKKNWKKCPDCQKRMRDNNLSTEEELQSWFIHRMEAVINAKGKQMIGWDEIIEGGLSPTATVMWWRSWSADAPARATALGNDVILTPNAQFYLDYAEDQNSIPNIYNFDTTCGLPDSLQSHILGVQGNVWCEWIPSEARMQYMAIPRLLAIAELGWSNPSKKDITEFRNRLAAQFHRLNIMGINYHIPSLEGIHTLNAFTDQGTVTVTCPDPTAHIRYTTDGTEPTLQSPLYTGTPTVTESTDFTFRTFRPDGKPGDIIHTRFVKDTFTPATELSNATPGLSAAWHEFTGNKCALITEAPLNGTYVTEGVDIPAEAKGNIGLVITGYITVPNDGIYTFDLLSDDGSILNIDGMTILDNDGPHAPVEITGQKALAKGAHPIEVRYFDQNGGTLKLRVFGPDRSELPAAQIYSHL